MTASLDPRLDIPTALVAAKPGTLPHDGSVTVGGVDLPAGHRCRSEHIEAPDRHPVLWATDAPVAEAGHVCRRLQAAFAHTGLWPVILEPLHGQDDAPWETGDFEPGDPQRIVGVDLHDTLEELWRDAVPDPVEPDDTIDPFIARVDRAFPGLAEGNESCSAAEVHAAIGEVLDHVDADRIGLVPARRPADVLTVLGWMGALNHDLEMWRLSAVLRSWEDRFGAYLVGLGFDTVEIAVAAPPVSLVPSVAVAVEHFSVCPDIVRQGAGSIEAYAEQIAGARVWSFWWD